MRRTITVLLLATGCAAGPTEQLQVRTESPVEAPDPIVETVPARPAAVGTPVPTTVPPATPEAVATTTTTTVDPCTHRNEAGQCVEWYGASGPDPGSEEFDRSCQRAEEPHPDCP